MRNLISTLTLSLLLAGCGSEKVDTKFLETPCEECPIVEVQVPLPCEETIYGQLRDAWVDRIDSNNVKLNHYVDDVLIEENLADVVDIDGNLVTSNPITIPEYVGQPMRHVLIVEFWQTD